MCDDFEQTICAQIVDRLLTDMGHSTEVSPKRTALMSAIERWREKYHHVDIDDANVIDQWEEYRCSR